MMTKEFFQVWALKQEGTFRVGLGGGVSSTWWRGLFREGESVI